jgi:RNA polymerase sigma-70 factor (ECF subfamily)
VSSQNPTIGEKAPVDEDTVLVAGVTRGDLGAFEQLVERHRDVVVRVAARIVGEEEAEDVSQDAFLRAFHRLERFRGDAPFRSWLLRITHNAALDHVARRRPEPVDPSELDSSEPDRAQRAPAERLEVRERIERLERKLHGLAPAHRAVLVLKDVEGFSYEEIAAITETPLGSVKGRLHRARREFIDMLRANTYDWELPQ